MIVSRKMILDWLQRLNPVKAPLVWVVLYLAALALLLITPVFGPVYFGLSLICLGAAAYLMTLYIPGPYLIVVPATAVIIAGVLVSISAAFLWPRLELLLFLWTLVFPIGVGIGMYAWGVLDIEANAMVQGGPFRTALACVRAGVALCWVLGFWAYVGLHARGLAPTVLLLECVAWIVVAVMLLIGLMWLGSESAWWQYGWYGELLMRLQGRRRLTVSMPYASDRLLFSKQLDDVRRRVDSDEITARKDAEALPTSAARTPVTGDAMLLYAMDRVRLAEAYALAYAHAWNAKEFKDGVDEYAARLDKLSDYIGLWTKQADYKRTHSETGTPTRADRHVASPASPAPASTTVQPQAEAT